MRNQLSRGEELLREERWAAARREFLKDLRHEPANHWLLTRIGTTYYEERDYAKSLAYSQAALALEPACPLVLWDYAGALQMLERHVEALEVYARLVRRGPKRLATGHCGEGLGWARGLVADCHYRMSNSYRALGRKAESELAFVKCLNMRGPGCYSIYPLSSLA